MKIKELFEGGGWRKVATKSGEIGKLKANFSLHLGFQSGEAAEAMMVDIKPEKPIFSNDSGVHAIVYIHHIDKLYYQKALEKIISLCKDLDLPTDKPQSYTSTTTPSGGAIFKNHKLQDEINTIVENVLTAYKILSDHGDSAKDKVAAQRELIDKDLEDYV